MNENQTLEVQIKAKSDEALQSLNKLINGLSGIDKQIGNVNAKIDGTSKSMKKFNSLFTFVGIKRMTKTMLNWMSEAVDQTEQLNLFNVVFKNITKNGTTMYSKLGQEATKFQYKMNETFGTNKTETFYMQGIFQSMGENVGIGSEYSAIMSETMTKLTYDLASLYNKSEATVGEALRAGVYAG